MSREEKLAGYDEAAAALIDRELPGMGRAIVVAAKAMFEAEHGSDAYANATVPRRAHYRFLATLALRPAISRLSAEVQELWEALSDVEAACDGLAATRSQATYLSMIDADHAEPELQRLDEARRRARAALHRSNGGRA